MRLLLLQMFKQFHVEKNVFANKWRSVVVLMIFLCINFEGERIKLMHHPTFSPDFSPCDFCLFTKMKEQLRVKNLQDMNLLVQERIEGLRKEDFEQCFDKVHQRQIEENYFQLS